MADLPNAKPEKADSIPEAVRIKLNTLAKKLEEERRSLEEARLLREAEVKALQTEITKRESVSTTEKKGLEQELTQRKSECEDYQKKEQAWNETRNAWETERRELISKIDQSKEELERLQEELKNKEDAWQAEKLSMIQTIQEMKKEIVDLKEEYQKQTHQLDKQYQEQISKEVDELERLLDEARATWHGKTAEKK